MPVEAIIGEIRDRIGVWRPLPAVTFRETAIDYLVHGQDIAVPLGRTLPVPPGLAIVAADRVWSSPRIRTRKRLAGYRLVADDAPWSAGQGHEISGPISTLLLLHAGRPRCAGCRVPGQGPERALHACRRQRLSPRCLVM